MGAKVAPTKSYNFSSHPKARTWLKDTLWEHFKDTIQVVTDFRYLGAHRTTRAAANSSAMDERGEKAIRQLKRLRYCPADADAKARAIQAKIYA